MRVGPAFGTALFAFAGPPAVVAGVIPWLLSGWRIREPLFQGSRAAGLAVAVAGGLVVGWAMTWFVRTGHGTPAPWAAPKSLVATGPYRWIRNPMYTGVVALVLGQGLVLGSIAVLVSAVVTALVFQLFLLLYEEPALRRRYGPDYEAYCDRAGRWLPRLQPASERPARQNGQM